jgi:hypothetical protein
MPRESLCRRGDKTMLVLFLVIIIYVIGIVFYIKTKVFYTSKEARRSMLWPILLILWIIQGYLLLLNEGIIFVTIIIGYNYKESKICKRIIRTLLKNLD